MCQRCLRHRETVHCKGADYNAAKSFKEAHQRGAAAPEMYDSCAVEPVVPGASLVSVRAGPTKVIAFDWFTLEVQVLVTLLKLAKSYQPTRPCTGLTPLVAGGKGGTGGSGGKGGGDAACVPYAKKAHRFKHPPPFGGALSSALYSC